MSSGSKTDLASISRWGREMSIRHAIAGVLLFATAMSVSFASQPFVMGTGRYLPSGEKAKLLDHFRHTGHADQRKRFQNAFRHLEETAIPHPPKVEIVEFSKFHVNTVFSKDLREGETTYMVCFSCEEIIPPEELAARKKTKARLYGIWVLSGQFMVIQQHPSSGEWWLVLDEGAAE